MKPTVQDRVADKFSGKQIISLVSEYYGKNVQASQLVGELDLNFFLTDEKGKHYVLKIAHAGENLLQLQLQNALMNWLAGSAADIRVQRIIRSLQGEEI